MTDTMKPHPTILDYVTGGSIPDVGAERNRQALERYLVAEKGYDKQDIEVDVPIAVTIQGQTYRSRVDLVVRAAGLPFMAVKCAAGSLGSREREILAAARLLDADRQVPLAVVSDGRTAIVLDTVTGKVTGEGLDAIPTKDDAGSSCTAVRPAPLDPRRREREMLIFRSYDMDNVNVVRERNL